MKKKSLLVVISLLLVALMISCASEPAEVASEEAIEAEDTSADEAEAAEAEEAADTETSDDEHYVFAMTTMVECSFFDAVYEGARSVIEANGDELIYVEGKLDAEYQQGVVEDFIAQDVDMIFYNPSDSAASLPSLKMMQEAGIPVINFDSKAADLSYVETYCATDNYDAGVVLANYMMEEHPDGGKVAIIEYRAVESASQRVQGFIDTITEAGTWEIVEELDGGNTTDTALPVAEDIITAHPDLTAMFGNNDETGLAIYSAVKAQGLDIDVYSINGGPESKNSIKKDGEAGIWRASAAQSPIVMGETVAELAYKYLDGEELDAEYLITPFIISPANIDQYGDQDWQ